MKHPNCKSKRMRQREKLGVENGKGERALKRYDSQAKTISSCQLVKK
jgi:hypothetical protein